MKATAANVYFGQRVGNPYLAVMYIVQEQTFMGPGDSGGGGPWAPAPWGLGGRGRHVCQQGVQLGGLLSLLHLPQLLLQLLHPVGGGGGNRRSIYHYDVMGGGGKRGIN